MTFGRQNNLVRRPVRPDGRVNRELRRRAIGKNSLLDLKSAKPTLGARLGRLMAKMLGR